MVLRIILAKTEHDYQTTWTDIKTIEVETDFMFVDEWHVIGGEFLPEKYKRLGDKPE